MNELIYDFKELQRSQDMKLKLGEQDLTPEEVNEYEDELKTLKANIRFLNFYKLSMKVCLQVEYYNVPENKDLEMSASLANILVLPPVHEIIKKKFYHIAIQENIKFNCYKVALKLIKSFGKQLKNVTEQELQDLEGIKKYCEDNMEHNKSCFEWANWPQCDDNLPFGHATPSCNRCKSKILFWNETLIPLTPEIALRCPICFATFDSNNDDLFIPDSLDLCPSWRFGTLKLVNKTK